MTNYLLVTMLLLIIEQIFHNIFRIVFMVLLVYFFIKKYKQKQIYNCVNKIPAVKLKFFHIFGHLTFVLQTRFRKRPLPVHIYDFIRATAYLHLFAKSGISHVWHASYLTVVLTKADFTEVLLNHSSEIKKSWVYDFLHPWLGTGLLTSHGEKWKHRRKQLTTAFHFNILKDFVAVFNKQSKILVEILDKHSQDDHVNIVPLITHCSLDIICESILGKELHTQRDPNNLYIEAVKGLTASVFERRFSPLLWPKIIFYNVPFGKRFIRNKFILHDFTNQMITEKKKLKLARKSSNDRGMEKSTELNVEFKRKKRALLDLLLDEHIDNNSITEEEIREEVDTFTFEGHDTTSMAMSWSLYLIGLHPWVQEKIHNELDDIFDEDDDRDVTEEDLKNMKYLECVLKESLRLYPSVPVIAREVKDDLKIDEYFIPKGSTCAVYIYMLHRDPDMFPNPEKFDPERFFPENITGRHPFAYVPFSAGPRNCIGQRFALMEEKTILSSILRKYKLRSLDPRDKVHLLDELVLRPYSGLRIQIRKRNEEFDFHPIYYRP